MPSILETHLQDWPNEAACAASATALARAFTAASLADATRPPDAFIELHGPLGAGKTTFVRHLLHALGVEGRVKSPTYAVMESYEVGRLETGLLDIRHFDFYRFDDPQEFEDAGFRDVFASPGLKLAEWPEKAAEMLPESDLRVDIEPGEGEARHVRFTAHSAMGVKLLIANIGAKVAT